MVNFWPWPKRVKADVAPVDVDRRGLYGAISEQPWQRTLRNHPVGLITWIDRSVAKVAGMVPLHIEEQRPDGTWTKSDDPIPNALLKRLKNPAGSQSEIVYQMVMAYHGPGECYGAAWDTGEGIVYDIFQFPAVEVKRGADEVHIKRTRDARPADGQPNYLVLPASQVHRMWVPDEEWKGDATSIWKDLVDDITRYAVALDAVGLGVDSRLLTNGILWAPEDSIRPGPNGGSSWIEDYLKLAEKSLSAANEKRKQVASRVPFPMSSKSKPEFIDVGQGVAEHLLEAERRLLENIARCSPLPMQLVIEGPGAGNHWADALLERSYLKFEIDPTMQRVTGDMTAWILTPRLEALRKSGWFTSEKQYRIGHDITDVANRDDNIEQLIQAWRDGIIDREIIASALGVTVEELLALPPGVSEYDHWRAVRRSRDAVADTTDTQGGDEALPETIDAIPTDPSIPVSASMERVSLSRQPFEAEVAQWSSDRGLCPCGNCS